MKAILINPIEQTITAVEHEGNLQSLLTLLKCQTVDVARFDNPHRDAIYVDAPVGRYASHCVLIESTQQ